MTCQLRKRDICQLSMWNDWNLPHVWIAIVRLCAATSQVETPVYTFCLFMYVCLCTQEFLPARWRHKAGLWQTKHAEDSNRSFCMIPMQIEITLFIIFDLSLLSGNIASERQKAGKIGHFPIVLKFGMHIRLSRNFWKLRWQTAPTRGSNLMNIWLVNHVSILNILILADTYRGQHFLL